jgi:hypothetical protein
MKVEYIDHMGSDLSVVNAARVSFDKESSWEHVLVSESDPDLFNGDVTCSKLRDSDAKLIQYLATHGHWSPFAHVTVLVRKDANDDTPATQELSIRADTPEQAKTQAIDTIALMSMEVVDITDVELMPHSDPTDADISEPAAKPAGTEVIPTIDVV